MKTTIYVEPVGKARPRVVGGGVAYTPQKTAGSEALIRISIRDQQEYFDRAVPLRLVATFYRERPKSLKKNVVFPVSRPDLDNYLKLLTDALEKYIYHNDSQIVTAVVHKRFGTPPRIELELEIVNE